MWYWMLLIGFTIASIPSMVYQVFNGISMLGLMICLLSAGFILLKEVDR